MSHIGDKPIEIIKDVSVVSDGKKVEIKGKNGSLSLDIFPGILIEINNDILMVKTDESLSNQAMHGTTRALIDNMITGVSKGYKKTLQLVGVGYHAVLEKDKLTLSLGYSNPVIYNLPSDVKCEVDKKGMSIALSGINKQKVGQVASDIRSLRPPEPYKGKGVRYSDEKVRRKVGKTAGK